MNFSDLILTHRKESAFTANASIAATENFSTIPLGTDFGIEAVINEVNFTSIGAGNIRQLGWLVSGEVGVHKITFGMGQYVTAIGLTGIANKIGEDGIYQIEVAEVGGMITQYTLPHSLQGNFYWGLTSTSGITTIHIRNGISTLVSSYFAVGNWSYIQFSRSEVLGEPGGTAITIPIPYGGNPSAVPLPPLCLAPWFWLNRACRIAERT